MPTSPSDSEPRSPAEDAGDAELRDPEQPPADQREAAAQILRVLDLEPRRILGTSPSVNGGYRSVPSAPNV